MSSIAQYYCYHCGTPWPSDEIICLACGGHDRSLESARPTKIVEDDETFFNFPFDDLPWPRQGSAGLVGGPGSGKSSIAAQIDPKWWLSREMEPKLIGRIHRRVRTGFDPPQIRMVKTAEDIARILPEIEQGPIVLDSATALATARDGLEASHLLDSWAKRMNDRVLVILQINKAGESAGYQAIPHLFDTIIDLTPDQWGMRMVNLPKSRWTTVGSKYWVFDEKGQIAKPVFDAAYSVEGTPGNYWLHPFPMPGARWSGILKMLDDADQLEGGVAGAAIPARYMRNTNHGFVDPPDKNERRRFAERHDLKWITPSDLPDAAAA